ncbi:hypothetical protein Tco_0874288 [Tanacetum coccineum]|uniref:Uncharacterized protein n=1 Tax=Tanacetum coccineum TaxID=301880 RepID=A0ABQ5BP56_9ASTR
MQLTLDAYLLPHLFTSWSDLGTTSLVTLTEDKEYYLEHPIPAAPVAQPGEQIPPEDLAAHAAWVKGQKEVAVLMLLTIDLLIIQRNLDLLGDYDMLQETLKALVSKTKLTGTSADCERFHTCKHGRRAQAVSIPLNELLSCLCGMKIRCQRKMLILTFIAIRAGRVQKDQKNKKPHIKLVEEVKGSGQWRRVYGEVRKLMVGIPGALVVLWAHGHRAAEQNYIRLLLSCGTVVLDTLARNALKLQHDGLLISLTLTSIEDTQRKTNGDISFYSPAEYKSVCCSELLSSVESSSWILKAKWECGKDLEEIQGEDDKLLL